MKKLEAAPKTRRGGKARGPAAATKPAPPEARVRAQDGLDGLEFLTPCEAVTWAAFGQALKVDQLMQLLPQALVQWNSSPKAWMPKLFFFFGEWKIDPQKMLEALEVFDSSSAPLSEMHTNLVCLYLERREELDLPQLANNSEHIEFLRQYLLRANNLERVLIEKKNEFHRLIRFGHIRVGGGPFDQSLSWNRYRIDRPFGPARHFNRAEIKPEMFIPGVSMDLDGYLTDVTPNILFEDIMLDLEDVRRIYPVGPIMPIDAVFFQGAPSSAAPVEKALKKRHAGGKPRSSASLLVQQELVRLQRLSQLPADKAAAKEQMTHFLMDKGYEDPLPSEQSFENWIKPFYSKS